MLIGYLWRLKDLKYINIMATFFVSTRVSMEVEGSLCETNVYVKCHQTCQRTNVLNLNVYR